MNQKSISLIVIILTIIGIFVIGGEVWYWQSQKEKSVVCPQDTKLCPNGSYVFRTGSNCEFAACPEKKDETVNLKTYRNEKYKFEVKYPAKYFLLEFPSHVEFSEDESGAGMGYHPTSIHIRENPEQLSLDEWLEKNKKRYTEPSGSILDLQRKDTKLGRAIIFRVIPHGKRYALIEMPQNPKIIIQVTEGNKDSFETILDTIKSF